MSELSETLEGLSLSPVEFVADRSTASVIPTAIVRRWEDHLHTFNTLLAEAPGVHQALLGLVRTQLRADPVTTALRFQLGTGGHTLDVSLVALAAHVRHHPQAPADLDDTAQVVALDNRNPLLHLTPTQLLARLASLDIVGAVRQQWNSYWQARAKGTPVSRRTHAQNQYHGLLSAHWEAALATGEFNAQQQRPVNGVLANPEWLRLDNKQLYLQTPSLAGKAVAGALLFSVENEPGLVLYRPGKQPAFTAYETRQALTDALMEHASDSTDTVSFQNHDALSAGFTTLFDSLLDARLKALAHDPGADIRQYAELALSLIHWVDREQRNPSVLHPPPVLVEEDHEAVPQPSFFDFGNLRVDIPYPVRLQQINRQRHLLDSITEQNLQSLQDQHNALAAACEDAEKAAEQQLLVDAWRTIETPTAAGNLIAAHHKGLRAHARLQNLLGQIDDEELRWMESLLDAPDAFPSLGSSIIAAHPLLKTTRVQQGTETVTSTVVQDCIVVTLQEQNAQHSLLLYWPGEQGGLLRCANQSELERCFGLSDSSRQSLSLSPITGDVLAKVLTYHLTRCKAAAQTSASASASTADDSLARIRESLAQSLQVPRHAAREYAFGLMKEQQASATLSGVSFPWLTGLTTPIRAALKSDMLAYIDAMRRSQALIARDLPHLSLFCRQHIYSRLVQDFPSYDGSPISIDLPKSTSKRKEPIAGSGAPGVPYREVLVASDEREVLSLETLLLEHVDDAMKNRLRFMTLHIATSQPLLEQALQDGINAAYLVALTRDLDLAQKREDMILAAYRGTHEGSFARQFRRECLGAPLRLMLKMQSTHARATGDINAQGQAIFDIAIDADNAEAFLADGHSIRLIPARLTAGGEDTEGYGVTLSGVTFVTDEKSDTTLLYRPDHPKKYLRQYASLEDARMGLYELIKQSAEIDYLADRALLGDPDTHKSRMRQAIGHRFDGIIGLGSAWPSTTSLAQHLLDAQGGRVLEAHRATSRSNNQLWLENFAYQSGMIFNYIKMALGFVPGVGILISTYDYYQASFNAAAALVRGDLGKALDELEQALLAFIDGAMDLLPGVVVKSSAARQFARQRQLLKLLKGPKAGFRPGSPSAAKRLARFDGYEYQTPLSLKGTQPGLVGKYRGIYRHAEGDFILVEDRPCQVEWLETEHTWRLRGNTRKTWRKNIALDETGQWDSHFALYGVHLQGGGAGGGQTLGRLVDVLAPHWPVVIRDRLPTSWTDVRQRQYRRLLTKIEADSKAFQLQTRRVNDKYRQGLSATDQELEKDITDGLALYKTHEDFLPLASRANAQATKDQMSATAKMLTSRYQLRFNNSRKRYTSTYAEIEKISRAIDDLTQGLPQTITENGPTDDFYTLSLAILQKRNQALPLRRKLLEELEALARPVDNMKNWRLKITRASDKKDFISDIDELTNTFTQAFLNGLKIDQLKELISRPATGIDSGWINLQVQMSAPRRQLDRMLYALDQLPSISHSKAQRSTMLTQGIDELRDFKNNLRYWRINQEEYLDPAVVTTLEKCLDDSIDHYSHHLNTPNEKLPAAPKKPPTGTRIFQTSDDIYLIGTPTQERNSYSLTGINGRNEIYTQGADGKFTLQNPDTSATPADQLSLSQSQSEARKTLNALSAFRDKVDGYADQGLEPASLEDLMLKKARDLNTSADKIEHLRPTEGLIDELRTAARKLLEDGRHLRIQQILKTQKPNAGHLEYLDQQNVLEIEKIGNLVELRKRPDGRPDFLQEYAIYDRRQRPRRTLWYAHFHYNKQNPSFTEFDKAHLKIPAQRKLGAEWQSSQIENVQIWRGDLGRPLAERIFSNLF
ncbi:dermonecrotic toxin domain-containing protein [Pseudomonas donghuensis]|uniref:dermonecrotic toxin domain-containing protein n=1 Tax=Pseudomonas donghuensis TaxID=1163398 RepID=UPI002E0F059C|nr:DUF6543 domain-containing protein [Pseudomonas donghuensis]